MDGDEMVGVGRCIRSSDPFLRSAAIDAAVSAWTDASDHAKAVVGEVLVQQTMAESRVELTRLFNAAFSVVTVPGTTEYLREQASSPEQTARRLAQRALDIRSGVGLS